MESDGKTILLAVVVGAAILVLVGPPVLLALYHKIRHRRGRRRSAHRSHDQARAAGRGGHGADKGAA